MLDAVAVTVFVFTTSQNEHHTLSEAWWVRGQKYKHVLASCKGKEMGGGLSRLFPLWRTVSPSEPHTAHIKRCCEDVRSSLHGLCFTILIHPPTGLFFLESHKQTWFRHLCQTPSLERILDTLLFYREMGIYSGPTEQFELSLDLFCHLIK